MKKRVLSLILAMVLVCALLPTAGAVEYTVTEVVPCKYNSVRLFSEGLAPVMVVDNTASYDYAMSDWGFIDKTGKEVVPCKYDEVGNFSGGLAAVGLVTGEEIGKDTCIYRWGFIDKDGKEVIPLKYLGPSAPVFSFPDGLAAVCVGTDYETAKWGYIDKTGKEVIPCKYDGAETFSEGFAAVKLDGKWGFIDKAGNQITPFKYTNKFAPVFSDGFAAVKADDKWGFVNTTGEECVSCLYGSTSRDMFEFVKGPCFSDGLALVGLDGGDRDEYNRIIYKPLFVDTSGKVVIPLKYDEALEFSEGLAAVSLDGKWGLIDTMGKEVVPCKYDYIDKFSDGLARAGLNDKRGFIDRTGKEVIPCKYDVAWDFSDGLAKVELDGKWGFVDATGKEVVPCKYDGVMDFSEGLVVVRVGDYSTGKWGLVDATGKEVVPCKYDEVAYSFSESLARVKLNDKYGFIDTTGKEVVPCKYDGANSFAEGFARVKLNDKWGFIDKTGNEVVPYKYDDAWGLDFSEGLARVCLDRKYGFIAITEVNTAYPSTQEVEVDGKKITFQCYALKDAAGNDTNYIKLRDLADILNGSAAQFQVGWDGNVTITTKAAYTKTGFEQHTPFSGQRTYEKTAVKTLVDGKEASLDTFQLKDDNGGGYTYYKLRDLGKALGITVDWTAERGIYIETTSR